MEYSIVENGVVVNVAVADSPIAPNWHEGNYGIGTLFDGVNFTAPAIQAPPVDPSIAIRAQLAQIDAETTKPRTQREVMLGNQATITWLAAKDAEAAALRAQL